MISTTIRETVATLFFSRRLTPSLKKVEEGRICTIYALSSALAGAKASRSTCRLNGFFNISFPPYSNVMRGSTTLYRMSLTRFIMTISAASTMVVPIISG